jgi:hypothetical protein
MMNYKDLTECLQELEHKWRGSAPRMPESHPCHGLLRCGPHNIQYFACSDHTTECNESLPVLVDVGINYTQGHQTIPDQSPSHPGVAPERPRIDDRIKQAGSYERACIASFEQDPVAWRSRAYAPAELEIPFLQNGRGKEFHLVMTNFCPWITTESWRKLPKAVKEQLLDFPPHRFGPGGAHLDRFAHLTDLHSTLGGHVALWLGHGVEAVELLFSDFVKRHNISNWLMAANIASGTSPTVRGGRLAFVRAKRTPLKCA